MTLSAWGLAADFVGVIAVGLTTKWLFGRQADVSSIGRLLRRARKGGKVEGVVDFWGMLVGWLLILLGFALQLADEVAWW